MDKLLNRRVHTYARRKKLRLAEPLGHGVHGTIYASRRKSQPGSVAVKAHRSQDGYERERDVYLRLKNEGIDEILGFNVPRFISSDDQLLVLEMTIVARPFVLDFAGAYLDHLPHFSDEIWAEWETQKRDQFEHRWPMVQKILNALEELDIHMIDVSPSNVAFAS